MTDVVRHLRPGSGPGVVLDMSPESVGWRYLSSRIVVARAGRDVRGRHGRQRDRDRAARRLGHVHVRRRDPSGRPDRRVHGQAARPVPAAGTAYAIGAVDAFEVAIGEAPATGRYPARLYTPGELPAFARGGANVSRGVTATFDPTFDSERLIAYEILTPSGNWSSFPPHRHDGREGTTYHEESYYYRLSPADGFAIQRIYTRDTDLDVSIAVADGDLVLVHEGYHTVAVAPGTNAYYLNFLAGDTKPVVQLNDPAYAWIVDDWTGRPIAIPLAPAEPAGSS